MKHLDDDKLLSTFVEGSIETSYNFVFNKDDISKDEECGFKNMK